MKNWPYIAALVVALCLGAGWAYDNREQLGLTRYFSLHHGNQDASDSSVDTPPASDATSSPGALKPATIEWRSLNNQSDGFKVEMPAGPKDAEAPAFNETGGTEPIKMLRASPGGDTVYAITWADNPPIARANNHRPDRTLDQARDGMLASTQATLVSETRITVSGFPGREISAHNSAGGILNARLIYIPNNGNDRLYTLMALFPTPGARNEKDVTRFFSSFQPQRSPTKG